MTKKKKEKPILSKYEVELTEDEFKMLTEISEYKDELRCDGCGHLWVLHNGHCCEFCMVAECNCNKC